MSVTTPRPDLDTPRAQVLLAIADDALVTGHRASHWTGVAPSLEEDLAFSTIAQDAINHADLLYQVLLGAAVSGEQQRAGVDAIGLGREPDGYRHAIVCERPPIDFARTLARHWITTRVEVARLDALRRSPDADVAAVATKLSHELRYHREHAEHWFTTLHTGGADARERFHTALGHVLPEALGFFEPVDGEDASAILPGGHPGLRDVVVDGAATSLRAAGFDDLVGLLEGDLPAEAAGGRRGRHSQDFTGDVWPEMTELHRVHPGARW
ncbi:MAG: phenylacetate-CoA oxygenase subunit PaaC [Nitriliruptoraceae bacterium]|nr:phenylacetate-CoA oxygenase subunit PaaC [Nitriliruptoraceae bacterium]